jgi:tetratricopeptide (TPR) repeat protein
MKNSISVSILILVLAVSMVWAEMARDKSAKEEAKKQMKKADEKSVVEKAEDKKDRDKAIEVKEWMARGYAAFKIKDYDEAIKCYKEAIALNPKLAKAHYNLGTNYSNKGMLDEAIPEFKQALTINPNYAEAHNNLGNVYDKKGMLDEALSEYKKAVTINPDLPPANYNLGLSYSRKGLNYLAAEHLHKAGLLFLKQGNREWALRAYEDLKLTNSKELEQKMYEKLHPEVKQKKGEPSK